MLYKEEMYCKHFKGETLLEKNIYKIIKLGVNGCDIDENVITYSGDGDLLTAKNLVVYQNIFQENMFFAREYEDLSSLLSSEKQEMYHQKLRVEPLTDEEINIIFTEEFKNKKLEVEKTKRLSK